MTASVLLDFVSHTDFSGSILQDSERSGAALLSAYFQHLRAENPGGVVVLDAGDLGISSPVVTDGGEPVIDVLNQLGYDAVTLGNHELDHGPDYAARVLGRATFPLLCANVVYKEGGGLLEFARPYVMVERQGVRIAIIGVTTVYTPFMMRRDSFDTIEMRDPVAVCTELVPHVRDAERADVVVVVSHFPGRVLDGGQVEGELFEFAEAVDGVDVLFGGHNPGDIAIVHDGAIVNKTGFARAIGRVRIAVDHDARRVEPVANEIIEMVPNSLGLEPDAAVAAAVEAAVAPMRAHLEEVVAEATGELTVPYRGEFSMGDFFTDCMRDACATQVALMNSTSCWGTLRPGPITVRDVKNMSHFNDPLHRGTMSGAQLRAIFELTYDDDHRAVNGDLQVSGLRVRVDTRRPNGGRVLSLTLDDGTPIDDGASYTVATSDYLADGGNGYGALFTDTTWEQMPIRTQAAYLERIRGRTLGPETEGRVVDVAEPEGADW